MTKFILFPTTDISFNSIKSIKFHSTATRTISRATFTQPTLSDDELKRGCRLGFNTWADTTCAGCHAHVISLCDNKTVTAEGFASNLGTIQDLSIANVAYAFDTGNGQTFILRMDNTIYLGEHMTDCLANPIQFMEAGTMVD